MDNKEKAERIYHAMRYKAFSQCAIEAIEAELNRLDAPEPKKWEPRGGYYHVGFVTSRMYPTSFEAERAAPLHRKLDRLVNWLVEHHKDFDGEFSLSRNPAGSLRITFGSISGKDLIDAIDSGDVEL